MKSLRRRFFVLLLSVLLLVGFSIPVNAEENADIYNYTKRTQVINDWMSTEFTYNFDSSTINDNIRYVSPNQGIPPNTYNFDVKEFFIIEQGVDNKPLMKGGTNVRMSVYGIYLEIGVDADTGFFYAENQRIDRYLVTFMDGSAQYMYGGSTHNYVKFNNGICDLEIEFTPSKDVKSIEFQFSNNGSVTSNPNGTALNIYSGAFNSGKTTSVIIQSTEEAGVLKNIFKSITDGFSNIGNWFSNLFNSITEGFSNIGKWFAELPQKLWAVISEGLKSLFVPDDDYMASYSDKWDSLLSSRFGAVYQVVDLVDTAFGGLEAVEGNGTIEFCGINLEDAGIGEGWLIPPTTVQIIPEGFEWLADSTKMVIGVICTLMFIGGMIKRYEEVMTK